MFVAARLMLQMHRRSLSGWLAEYALRAGEVGGSASRAPASSRARLAGPAADHVINALRGSGTGRSDRRAFAGRAACHATKKPPRAKHRGQVFRPGEVPGGAHRQRRRALRAHPRQCAAERERHRETDDIVTGEAEVTRRSSRGACCGTARGSSDCGIVAIARPCAADVTPTSPDDEE